MFFIMAFLLNFHNTAAVSKNWFYINNAYPYKPLVDRTETAPSDAPHARISPYSCGAQLIEFTAKITRIQKINTIIQR